MIMVDDSLVVEYTAKIVYGFYKKIKKKYMVKFLGQPAELLAWSVSYEPRFIIHM